MAILNIKNFPNEIYERIRERAKDDRRSISRVVIQLLTEAMDSGGAHSVPELRGLGKSAWSEVDAASHVAQERDHWD